MDPNNVMFANLQESIAKDQPDRQPSNISKLEEVSVQLSEAKDESSNEDESSSGSSLYTSSEEGSK